jgi:LysR family cyn operon transcriptional activator
MSLRFSMDNDTFPLSQSMASIDQKALDTAAPGKAITMELRHLRYFTALAEHLNFTRAAEAVHVTQSTLSHQIKQLETEIGHRLFDRVGKRIVITDAGEQLLDRVKHALSEIDEGLRTVRGSAQQLSGNLRIGVTHTFNVSLLPACIDAFIQRHPSVRVTVHEQSAEAVARGVEAMAFDIGIGYRPRDASVISFEPLCNDEMALVVSRSHALAGRKRVRMVELHRQPVVLSTPDTTTRELLDEWFRSVGAEPIVVVEMNPIAPMLALVRRMNMGAIVSRQALANVDDLHIIPIESPTPLRTPGILWNRTQQPTPAAKSFAVIARNAVVGTHMVPLKRRHTEIHRLAGMIGSRTKLSRPSPK